MSLNTPRRRERRRAAGAGGPRTLPPPDRPRGALRGRRPPRRGSKEQTIHTLTGAARQTRHSVRRRDQSAPTKGRHGAAARAPIGGVRGGASFKPTQGGASPRESPALRLQPLGSRAGPPRPAAPMSPRASPRPRSLVCGRLDPQFPGFRALGSQGSARLATAPVPSSPCAWPRPQGACSRPLAPAPRSL